MTRQLLITLVIATSLAAPVTASTRAGSANPRTVQSWGFTPVGPGQAEITLSWTNRNARLIMALVCGVAEPTVFGIAAGNLDRVGLITAGVESDVPCEVGVSSEQGVSSYRIHFEHGISQTSEPRGRMPLALSVHESYDGSPLGTAITHHLEQVRLMLRARNGATESAGN